MTRPQGWLFKQVFQLVSQIKPNFQSSIISYWQHQGSELLPQTLIPGPKSLSSHFSWDLSFIVHFSKLTKIATQSAEATSLGMQRSQGTKQLSTGQPFNLPQHSLTYKSRIYRHPNFISQFTQRDIRALYILVINHIPNEST